MTLQHLLTLKSCGIRYPRSWKSNLNQHQCPPFLKKRLPLRTQKTLRNNHHFWKPCLKIQHRQRNRSQPRPLQLPSKKPNVPISSTPVVSEENDCKLQKYLLKGKDIFVWCYKLNCLSIEQNKRVFFNNVNIYFCYATCETTDSTPYYSPDHDENWPPSIPTDDETSPSFWMPRTLSSQH